MVYTASKTRSQRAGWSVTFRHPAVVNPENGKSGKRMRYGLGTREDDIADRLVGQLNELLSEDRWWSRAAQAQATDRFDARIVEIFYGSMQPEGGDSRQVREELLPLPGAGDGYKTVLLAGTTGAGKTTVLRQLIGTDPIEERFPTTATGRTTIADTEVVLSEGDYRAAVTFFSLDEVSHHLEDCVLQAVLAAHRNEPRDEIRRALLRHRDERFRFNYVLGDGVRQESPTPAGLSSSFSNFPIASPEVGMPELGQLDEDEAPRVLESLVDRVIVLAEEQVADIEHELGPAANEDDARALAELVEEELDTRLRDDDDVHELTDALIEEMRKRFDLIGDVGQLRRTRQGWPSSWSWSSPDRATFIRQLRRFTSNSKLGFGRLLTPLVDGVRVAGPFTPTWHDGSLRLVVLDTEGLGHTVETASSISTKLTRLVTEADAVVLVDNAAQPMQAAPATFLRALARTGHGAKLHLCFTHFDVVEGDNLPTPSDRAVHVLNSCDGVLSKIGTDLGSFAERPLRARLGDGSFFLADCHRFLYPEQDALSVAEFRRLVEALERSGQRPTLAETRPIYDRTNLIIAVRDAVEGFHQHWNALLGRVSSTDVHKAHWATVKALSRRFAVMNQDEYKDLHPVGDLQAWLQDQAWLMLQSPVGWTAGQPTVEEEQALYDELANRLSERLLDLSHERLFADRAPQWMDAFLRSGPGSTRVRSSIIAEQIYAAAAPVPQATPAPDQNEFLHRVIEVVKVTAAELGVELR